MTKIDYLSQEPHLVALVLKRVELTELIYLYKDKETSIKSLCDDNKMSTASFFRCKKKEYVTNDTWSKLVRMLCQVVCTEVFIEYMNAYYSLYNQVFTDAPTYASQLLAYEMNKLNANAPADMLSAGKIM